jgi:hypothetical protein
MQIKEGTKLALRCWHQDSSWQKASCRFAPDDNAIGEVVEITSSNGSGVAFERIKIKLWTKDDPKGYQRILFRVTDTIWLEYIGIRNENSYLPHVVEIQGELNDDEFERRKLRFAE